MINQQEVAFILGKLNEYAPEFMWSVRVRDETHNLVIRVMLGNRSGLYEITAENAGMMFPPRKDLMHEAYETFAFTLSGNRQPEMEFTSEGEMLIGAIIEKTREEYKKVFEPSHH